ncbi:class I SAM-dependent methyltransferase [Mycobacterium sp. PS03-16]|uniref:class I SAM-dependent methyltransferase n=1 Tax=Mycobacterium sp. PS03-16 TaxID=2559611 RepID=UPI0010747CE9|nr:class I SAM-dependent methyltransferase [Mycobacterium sp. PS03-16]TFV60536.1 class I SAM-dependent methyltransferase [Mycobacterium sp. PS03-16]
MSEAVDFWEQHYGARDRVWSGRVNARLAEIAGPLRPGRALDLGCGEGGDAIWLAGHGWEVVAVDISATALQRAAEDARAAGVADRIDFQRHDLDVDFPAGPFDLVSAQFFHSPVDMDRTGVLRRASDVIAPDGLLVIVDHGGAPPWAPKNGHLHVFPSVQEVLAALDPDPAQWLTQRAESVGRTATGPDGQTGTLLDNVMVLRRRPAD